jgi:hypothetical protein
MIADFLRSKSKGWVTRAILALILCFVGTNLIVLSWAVSPTAGTNASGGGRVSPSRRSPDTSALPFVVAQPIRSTFDWIASFVPGPGLRPSFATKAAGPRSIVPGGAPLLAPVVSDAVPATVSPPVRDLPASNAFSVWVERPEPRTPENRLPKLPRDPQETDPVVQALAAAGMPPVGTSFEGMNIGNACGNCLPPDPVGAVGPNHYVQMVNSNFAIYGKNGAVLSAPKAINMLWSATPNSTCATHNNGDPIVLYDQLADRWMLSQFTVKSGAEAYAECIAISQTPDPAGPYWLYEFDEANAVFHDYPHLGVWPDGYYMSTNQFPDDATASTAAGAWAFERPKMLLGQPARYIFFDETPLVTSTYTPFGQLPSTLEGRNLPPPGTPAFFAEVDDVNTPNPPPATGLHDEMRIWRFHVDWASPANSTFGVGSRPPTPQAGFGGQYAGAAGQPDFVIPIADFIASACQIENGPNDCTPEKINPPQPPQYLDVLGDRLMFKLVYRNFGDHDALVANHTVDVADSNQGAGRNGVRWYELRNVSSTPVLYQQGTFAPLDATNPLWRWMGSIGMDHSGNIAAGFSASGPNYFPSLHYAGRLAGDPLNQLAQGEAVMFQGQGIEANTGLYPFRNRWGDYSAISVDPTDDCTFWYTNEYLAPNAVTDILPVDWHTRVGNFRFSSCAAAPPQLVKVASRKVHGAQGAFDIDLPLIGPPGVECRSGGATGQYTLVFTFVNRITNCGAVSGVAGAADRGADDHQCIASVSGLPNAQYSTVTLVGVTDSSGRTFDAAVIIGVLLGDVNQDRFVLSGDYTATRQNSGRTVDQNTFKFDVNTDGFILSGDYTTVRAQSASRLP